MSKVQLTFTKGENVSGLGIILFLAVLFPVHLFAGFPAGTPISTYDGSTLVELLQKEDFIAGYNKETCECFDTAIKDIGVTSSIGYYQFTTDGGIFFVSSDQLLYDYRKDSFKKAQDFQTDDLLLSKKGLLVECITTPQEIPEQVTCYDITLEESKLFFATHLEILCHNSADHN